VAAVILLGVSASFGNQARIAKTVPADLLEEAGRLSAERKGEQFLTSVWRADCSLDVECLWRLSGMHRLASHPEDIF
jgi:hypothetical protein